MRRLAALPGLALALGVAVLPGCGGAPDPLRAYLSDTSLRREALRRALWFADNDYARLRLRRFATGAPDAWERLPEWLPEAAPLRDGQEAAPRRLAVDLPEGPGLSAALLAIGAAAFFDYPAQLVGGFELLAASADLADAYGLWCGRAPGDAQDAAPRLGGIVRAWVPGGTALGLSCAACHARGGGAVVEPGRPGRLDIGALVQDQAPPGVPLPEGAWGPGRIDVSPDGQDNPSAIPDLRVVSLQRHLHHDATLRNDPLGIGAAEAAPLSLALRIESLIVTTLGQGARPPPAVALGLALYLWTLTPAPAAGPAPQRGKELYDARCAGCHLLPDGGGEPVPLSVVGTDPALGLSRERGTGTYRVPTLRRVAERSPLLHDGRVRDLEALLDPARLDPGYAGGQTGPGPVPGHRYGLDLLAAERADLIAFVSAM